VIKLGVRHPRKIDTTVGVLGNVMETNTKLGVLVTPAFFLRIAYESEKVFARIFDI